MINSLRNILLVFRLVWRRSYVRNCAVGSILALLAGGFGLAIPFIIKLTVDEGLAKKDLAVFLWLCLGAALAFVLKNILEALAAVKRTAFTEKIRFDMSRRVFRNIQAMPMVWFQGKAAGQAIYAVDSDTSTLINVVSGTVNNVFVEVCTLIAVLAMILALDITIGLAVIIFLPILFFLSRSRFVRLKEIYQDKAGNDEAVLSFLEESFWRSYLIKLFSAAGAAVRRYSRLLIRDVRLVIDRERQEAWSSLVPALLPLAVTGGIYVFSGYRTIKGEMTLGTLAAIGGYIYQFISSAGQLLFHWQDLQPGFLCAQRLSPFLSGDAVIYSLDKENPVDMKGQIKVNGLDFSYPGNRKIFEGFNMDVGVGEFVVIMGPSGCGKTTLLNLIMRLYPAGSGQITIDGQGIESLPRSLWGRRVVMCPQEPMLWNATIKDNIIYPDRQYDEQLFSAVARLAGVEDFVAGMKEGYETMVGENAVRISQGQKQRISLARSLIKRPAILLLDEAFSGLPQDEETRIISQARGLFAQMTIISATHRLAQDQSGARIIRIG